MGGDVTRFVVREVVPRLRDTTLVLPRLIGADLGLRLFPLEALGDALRGGRRAERHACSSTWMVL